MKNIEIDGDEALVRLNPDMFPLSVIYSAAYTLLDRAYFSFDGDPEEEVEVSIKSKKGEEVRKIALKFNNELVNYSVYENESERNKEVRQAIIERALATNLKVSEGEIEKVKNSLSPKKREEE